MKFKVVGADKSTGDDVEVALVAADRSQAEQLAHERGILVSALSIVDEPAPSEETPIALEPEDANQSHHATLSASGATQPMGLNQQSNEPEVPHPEYKIIVNQSTYLLERSITKYMKDGWEPAGGILTTFINNRTEVFQAIVRYPKGWQRAGL